MRTYTAEQKARALASIGNLPQHWRPHPLTIIEPNPPSGGISRREAARHLAERPTPQPSQEPK